MCEVLIYVMVDQDGDYVIAKDREELDQLYIDEISEGNGISKRIISVKLTVPEPVELTVTAEVPAEPNALTVFVK